MKESTTRGALIGLLLFYFFLATQNLTRLPVAHADEAWIASVSWQFAWTGTLGTHVFEGMDGMERRYYEFMPLYVLAQAPFLRAAGLGLYTVRFVSVVMGALLLVLTYRVGVCLRGAAVGLGAVALLLFARMMPTNVALASGILFFDVSRLGRYDLFAATLAMAALWVFARAHVNSTRDFFGVGVLTGLAGLAHLYAVIWLPIFLIVTWWEGAAWKMIVGLLAGFAAPWSIYGVYVLTDLETLRAQMRVYQVRFDIFSLAWYWNNWLQESRRYRFNEVGFRRAWEYPGMITMLCGGALGWLALVWRARENLTRVERVLLLAVPTLVLFFTFAIAYKLSNYLILLEPLLALIVAWGFVRLYQRGFLGLPRRWVRVGVILIGVCVLGDGLAQHAALIVRAAQTPAFEELTAQLRREIPVGARVLGSHTFWLALEDTQFRAVRVPFTITNPEWGATQTPREFLQTFAPQVVLLDDEARNALKYGERWGFQTTTRDYMRAHSLEKRAVFEYPSYGEIEIYSSLPPRVAVQSP